ncbi:MAG: hypothetical protein IKN08_01340 [Bacteroidales bacterium]|nr:hypothetical protein [Bacteroidales bacterium]
MSKKLEKAIKEANKELKQQNHFQNYQISVDGNFKSEYNEIRLSSKDGVRHFPICYAETEDMAIAIIKAYLIGLAHGKDKSYPKFCDKN